MREENWEGDITITANKKFKHFAMLNGNKKKKCYMAFDNTQDSNLPMVVQYLPAISINTIVRNQMSKDVLMLVQ
jgi:hypothetical protein